MLTKEEDICRMKLLIVDDDPDVNRMLCVMLSKNYPTQCIISAPDARAALRMASAVQPDIFLLDVFMPGCSGIELSAQLMSQNKNRIIIHMCEAKDYELINSCYEAGSKYYVCKPIDFEKLFFKLDALMVDMFYKRFYKGRRSQY